jgi:hypothetical protein
VEDGMSDVVILVGRRSDGGWRDEVWTYCKRFWIEETGLPIFEGFHDEGPFSLAIASNQAARLAGDWECAVYVGADWLPLDVNQVWRAVGRAQSGQLTFAHDHAVVLGPEDTKAVVRDSAVLGGLLQYGERHRHTFSGVQAIPRALWDAVAGFDERFIGWGYEDLAFMAACGAMGGGLDRVEGDIVHLWHPRVRAQREEQPHHAANEALWLRYHGAMSSRRKMKAILAERL